VPFVDAAKQLTERYATSLELQSRHGNGTGRADALEDRQAFDVPVDDQSRQLIGAACLHGRKDDAGVRSPGIDEPVSLAIDDEVAAVEPATQAPRGLRKHDGRQPFALCHKSLDPIAQ